MPFLPSSSCHVALFWYLVFKVITVLTVFRDETAPTERRRAVTSQISNLFFRIYVFQKRFAFSLRDSLVRPAALLILIFTNWKVKIRNCERHERRRVLDVDMRVRMRRYEERFSNVGYTVVVIFFPLRCDKCL